MEAATSSGPSGPTLNVEQTSVVDMYEQRLNLFVTGVAGTGKSTVLNEISRLAKEEYGDEHVAVCASTGVAAAKVNGCTVAAFFGLGNNSKSVNTLFKTMKRFKKDQLARIRQLKVLIIDEVSMISANTLSRVNRMIGKVCGVNPKTTPFGGVQVCFFGDFLQLSPIAEHIVCEKCNGQHHQRFTDFAEDCYADVKKQLRVQPKCGYCDAPLDPGTKLAFQHDSGGFSVWRRARLQHIELTEMIRQQGDFFFKRALNCLRLGVKDKHMAVLMTRSRSDEKKCAQGLLKPCPDDTTVHLFPTNDEVQRWNQACLELLQTTDPPPERIVSQGVVATCNPTGFAFYNAWGDVNLQPHLNLVEGARVMLLTNLSVQDHLVNGAEGTVVGFEARPSDGTFWSAFLDHDYKRLLRKRNKKNLDTSKCVVPDLRLCKALGLINEGVPLQVDKHPIVRFDATDSTGEAIVRTIQPVCCQPGMDKETRVIQYPLCLAWAKTHHKAQGHTFTRSAVRLSKFQVPGMAYVALSRSRRFSDTVILGFDERAYETIPAAVEFHQGISKARALAGDGNGEPQTKQHKCVDDRE